MKNTVLTFGYLLAWSCLIIAPIFCIWGLYNLGGRLALSAAYLLFILLIIRKWG